MVILRACPLHLTGANPRGEESIFLMREPITRTSANYVAYDVVIAQRRGGGGAGGGAPGADERRPVPL
eukprot:747246-Prorocentrum_minimum.AAC.1